MLTDTPQVYTVVTEAPGERLKKPKHGTAIDEKQYFVLATSVKQAVEIIETSNADTQAEETVTKAWLVTHITGGLAGTKFLIVPREPAKA